MKKFFEDFINFIKKGNVLDLAVGLIIGTAFNAIVKSLVNDMLMPIIGLIGGVNVADAAVELVPAVVENGEIVTPAVMLKYGAFIQSIIDFLLVALTIFVVVKVLSGIRNRMEKLKQIVHKHEEEKVIVETVPVEPTPVAPKAEDILIEIRDLLKEKAAHSE